MLIKYSKEIHGIKAREKLLKGAWRVNRAVSTTLGIRGKNIVTWQPHRTKLLHDGLKVSETVNPKDPYENAGAEIIKQAARQTVESVGDGTSVSVLLGYSIMEEALKVTNAGINPMSLRQGLEKGRDLLIKRIKELSVPVKTKEQKIQVATISSEDEQMGRLIGETYEKSGVDAVITAEEITGPDTFLDHQEGLQIDSGYKTEYFVTNPDNMTASVSNANILVTDYKLDDVFEIQPLFIKMNEAKPPVRNLVVIAEDIEGMVLVNLINNKMTGKANFLAIKAPSFNMKNILQDIATVVGAKFISSDAKMKLKEIQMSDLGKADKVVSTKDATTIRGGAGDPKKIKERIESIKNQIKEEEKEFDKEKLRERLAKLTGGVYVIRVGGHTEVEAEERRERADDAIRATKAAIQEGIIPGGEVIFLEAMKVLEPTDENEDYAYRILKNALYKPFKKLIENAGEDAGKFLAYLESKPFGYGVDITTLEIKDMLKSGIVDPTLVAITAIQNAVSVAVSMTTSDGIVAEYDEKGK